MTQRAAYEAVNEIKYNGVRAYSPGDPVDAAVVDGPAAWVDHEDVKPSGVIPLDEPPANAAQARWAAYAVSKGEDPGKAADASRAELIKRHATPPPRTGKAAEHG
jgi:hypothetical protein